MLFPVRFMPAQNVAVAPACPNRRNMRETESTAANMYRHTLPLRLIRSDDHPLFRGSRGWLLFSAHAASCCVCGGDFLAGIAVWVAGLD